MEPTTDTPRRKHSFFDDKSRYVDRFGLLLAVTIASIVILSLVDLVEPVGNAPQDLGSIAASILTGATLLLALRASGVARRWQRVADVVVAGSIAAIAIVVVVNDIPGHVVAPQSPAPLLIVILAAIAPVVVIRRLLQHRVVTRGTLLGAISAYLLIPIAFFYAFLSVGFASGSTFFAARESTTSFMYFSLSSITTLGYGDLAAVTELGRLLATSEAIIGQIYLITFVALLVSLFAQQWRGGGGGATSTQ
jgi:hypothetical protein